MEKLAHLAAIGILLAVSAVEAALIPHRIALAVESARTIDGRPCLAVAPAIRNTFGCDIRPGDVFIGHFAVDEALLAREGSNLTGSIFYFSLGIGGVMWDQNRPFCDFSRPGSPCGGPGASDFSAFRGPMPGSDFPEHLGAPAPGFDVHDGLLKGLRGGVTGSGDVPWLDFPFAGGFSAYDSNLFLQGRQIVSRSATPISEPPAIALLAITILFLLCLRALEYGSRRKT